MRRYPDSNYGQYIMLWDHAFGWFKPYPKVATKASAGKPAAASKSADGGAGSTAAAAVKEE